MPGKLRKSRSRNVTKSNNRPAYRQSRKRKTPKNNVSKGKARKTTRRRSKRGGMFGIRKSGSPDSPEKKALDLFMKVFTFYFLIIKNGAIKESYSAGRDVGSAPFFDGKKLRDIKYTDSETKPNNIYSDELELWRLNRVKYHNGNLKVIIDAMPDLDFVKTLEVLNCSSDQEDVKTAFFSTYKSFEPNKPVNPGNPFEYITSGGLNSDPDSMDVLLGGLGASLYPKKNKLNRTAAVMKLNEKLTQSGYTLELLC